ncbi:MAG: TlpA family protein disulfide reductase [Bacteroidia bacterium]|nr:TlpA family protein disulfide reductase [Bacteroidia bacterium]
MKKHLFFAAVLFLIGNAAFAQSGTVRNLPEVKIEDLKGQKVNTAEFSNEDGPMVISFWATWCKPCILELMTIDEMYVDLQEETGVKLIAISIDDARNKQKVAPFVNGKGWEYEVYIDENWDFKRAMGVNDVPHTFVVNKDGEVVWSHSSFSPGDEEELAEVLRQVAENGHPDE